MEQHKFAHPVGYFSLAIPEELIDLMVAEVDNIEFGEFSEATIGSEGTETVHTEIRNSKTAWWYEQHWVTSIFSHYFNKANRDLWEYDLTYLKGIQVTKYDEGDKYDWHCDYGAEYAANHTRKLSATLLITDPTEFEGGDLEFIDYHGNNVTAERTKGTMIIFDSRTPHRVTPVTKGTRISLVAWMLGPKLR
jgi:PKHD-type hydroxylase